jgi:hypothetical protein
MSEAAAPALPAPVLAAEFRKDKPYQGWAIKTLLVAAHEGGGKIDPLVVGPLLRQMVTQLNQAVLRHYGQERARDPSLTWEHDYLFRLAGSLHVLPPQPQILGAWHQLSGDAERAEAAIQAEREHYGRPA